MDRDEITKLMKAQQKISDRNYMNFQETGEQRYMRTHEKAEDIVWLCERAMSTQEDREKSNAVMYYITTWGAKAIKMLHEPEFDKDAAKSLLEEIRTISKQYGVMDPWK